MEPTPRQPNIVLVMTDQQRYDTINALGFPYMTTPNLDRLVREGVFVPSDARHLAFVRAIASEPLHRPLSSLPWRAAQ